MLERRLRRYLRNGTLTQLAAFEAVVRLGGFTRAAEALHMAQPTVSVLVRKLSETLGAPLFETTAPDIRLTEAGRTTLEFSRQFLRNFAAFDERLDQIRRPAPCALRIAVSTAGESLAAALLQSFCKTHPEVRLSLSFANRRDLLERMHRGTDDFYILASALEDARMRSYPLQHDALQFYASVLHPFAARERVTLEEIAGEPLLMREAGSATRDAAEAFFQENGLHPNVHMEMDDTDAIKRAVAAGFGVSLLSAYAVGPQPRFEALMPLRVDGMPLVRRWHVAHHIDRVAAPVDALLIAELTRQAADIEAQYAIRSMDRPVRRPLFRVSGKRRARHGE